MLEVLHPVLTEQSQVIKRAVQRRVTAPGRSVILWNANNNDLPRSFVGLIELDLDKAATTLRCTALVAHPVTLGWLNLTAKRRGYLIHHG